MSLEPSKRVGVLARLRVREQWIEISDVAQRSGPKKLKNFFDSLRKGDSASEHRKHLFERLLEHLVTKELQARDEKRDATLAVDAIVFSPAESRYFGAKVIEPRSPLAVDPTVIDAFISAPMGEEENALRELGVDLSGNQNFRPAAEVEEFCNFPTEIKPSSTLYFGDLRALKNILSASFGLVTTVEAREKEIEITLSPEAHEKLTAFELYEAMGANMEAEDALLLSGATTKGAEAYALAKALGFELSYQTLNSRFRKRDCLKTSRGRVVTYWELFSAIGCSHLLTSLAGFSYRIPRTSLQLVLDD